MHKLIFYQIFIVFACCSIEIDSVDYLIHYQTFENHLRLIYKDDRALINCTMQHLIDEDVMLRLSDETLKDEKKMFEEMEKYLPVIEEICKNPSSPTIKPEQEIDNSSIPVTPYRINHTPATSKASQFKRYEDLLIGVALLCVLGLIIFIFIHRKEN